jgi:1-deoxy-D-xylulose-5-phosphate synthase
VMGGAGSAVNEYLQASGINCPVLNLGLPDHFIEQGSSSQLLAQCGLDAAGIVDAVRARLNSSA